MAPEAVRSHAQLCHLQYGTWPRQVWEWGC